MVVSARGHDQHCFNVFGLADSALADVKISELGSWLNRRNVNPLAMFHAMMRAFHRFSYRFAYPRYAFPGVSYNQKVVAMVLFFTLINYKTLRK